MNMTKALFITPKNDFTGSTRVLYNILLSEYPAITPTIICQRHDKGVLSELPNARLISYSELKLGPTTIPLLSDIVTRIKVFFLVLYYGWNVDTIYVNTIVPYSAVLAGLLLQKKIIYHIHEKFLNTTMNCRIMEYVFNHAVSHRIFVSEYTKKQYAENPKCTHEIKYNKLPESFLAKVIFRPINERQRNRVLMIASLTLSKGIDVFVEVAKRLPTINFSLVLSASQTEIDYFFSEIDVPFNCVIFPSQSDIHPFLHNTDLLLSLTNPRVAVETFGMTILEAMPYGVPAIVPNVGGPIELVIDTYNGYCVDVTDANNVSSAISKSFDVRKYQTLCLNTLKRFNVYFR